MQDFLLTSSAWSHWPILGKVKWINLKNQELWDGQNLLVTANLVTREGKVRWPVEKSKEQSEFEVFHSRVWHGLPDACILLQPEYIGQPLSGGRITRSVLTVPGLQVRTNHSIFRALGPVYLFFQPVHQYPETPLHQQQAWSGRSASCHSTC